MPTTQVYYKGNDMVAEVYGLRDAATDAYHNAATVQATLKDATSGTPLTGQTWPKTLSYVTGSNGVYRGVLEDTLVVTVGQTLTLEITVTSSSMTAFWQIPAIAQTRTS